MENTSIKNNQKLFGASIQTLTERISEKSIKIPSGLTRDERRLFASKQSKQSKQSSQE